MIDDYKVVVAVPITNALLTGYFPTSYAAISSYSKYDFIDEVVVAEGFSEDNTVKIHQDISSKVKIISKKPWPLNQWNWQNLYDQYDLIYDYCRESEENIILMLLSSDQVFTDNWAEELRYSLIDLVNDPGKDFFLVPFAKTINYEYRTRPYDPMPHFHLHSALKFDKTRPWQCVRGPDGLKSTRGESKVVGPREVVRLERSFRNFPIAYDMFMFTRENLQHKIDRYGRSWDGPAVIFGEGEPWPEKPEDYVSQIWLRKAIALNPSKMSIKEHPIEMQEVIFNHMTDEHYGYSCFDLLVQQIGLGIRQ